MDHFQFAKSHYDGPSPWYIASLTSWSLPQLQSYPWFAWLEETWDLPRILGTNGSKWIQQMKFDGYISSMLHPPTIRLLALPLEWPSPFLSHAQRAITNKMTHIYLVAVQIYIFIHSICQWQKPSFQWFHNCFSIDIKCSLASTHSSSTNNTYTTLHKNHTMIK